MTLFEGRRLPPFRPTSPHPGLWLDRFLDVQTVAQECHPTDHDEARARAAKDKLIGEIEQKPLPDGYAHAFATWEQGLLRDEGCVVVARGESLGRVIVGIGQKGPAEFGITLHRTWGVPILPGSSLKGIAALGADRFLDGDAWRRRPDHAVARAGGPNAFDALFGDVEEQGAVFFHDAWLVPPFDKKNGLHRDVLTVHHPDYYQKDSAEPSDTDSPIPVPFVSAKGHFLVALELHPALNPREHGHWLEAAWMALREGLIRHGIGAKTNAGYGRVRVDSFVATNIGRAIVEGRREAERLAVRAELIRARSELPSAAARMMHVAQGEGLDAILSWAKTGGADVLAGIAFDADHVRAAAATLFAASKAGGVAAGLDEPAKSWWREGIVQPPVKPIERVPLQEDELDKALAPYVAKERWDRAAKALSERNLDADTLRRAVAKLTALGARPGHIKVLQQQLAELDPPA